MASDANARTLHSFLDYLRVERGSAKLTIAAYTSDLAQFADFLEKRHQFLTERGAKTCAPTSRNYFEFTRRSLGGKEAFGHPPSVSAFAA